MSVASAEEKYSAGRDRGSADHHIAGARMSVASAEEKHSAGRDPGSAEHILATVPVFGLY